MAKGDGSSFLLLIPAVCIVAIGAFILTEPDPEAPPAPSVEVETTQVPVVSTTCTKALFQANDAIKLLAEALVISRKGLNETLTLEQAIKKSKEIDQEIDIVLEKNLRLTEQCILEEGT